MMQGEPGVLDHLNKALRHELTAVNQYWLHYRLLDNWGYKALAKQWRKESIEEMQHADKLVERITFLDGFPNMQVLDPLHIGQNVKEVLDCVGGGNSEPLDASRVILLRRRHPQPPSPSRRRSKPLCEKRGGFFYELKADFSPPLR
jgi:hypothetical protein